MSLLGSSEKESREAIYRFNLPFLIEEEIYKYLPKAKSWRLGKLHFEWNDLLESYLGLCILAPRSHLKTFFFFEARTLQLCKFFKDVEIRYFTGSDAIAVSKLDNIKQFAKLPYFSDLLVGAEINNRTELRFGGNQRVYVQGFNSKIRGGHPDYIILDDIIDSQVIYSDEQNKKTKERLATEILPMAEPHTQIVIVGTLQREDDLYSIDWGEIMGRDWISKSYDAILDEEKHLTLFPEKWDWDALMAKKAEITLLAGERWFEKEYRNRPVNFAGEIIKPEWIRFYDSLPSFLGVLEGWDLAVGKDPDSGDWTATCVIGYDQNMNVYVLDVWRDRIDFSKRLKKIAEFALNWRPQRIFIEENVFQADTVQTLKSQTALPIYGIKSTKNKIQRFHEELVPLFENGKVFFRKGDQRQEILIHELLSLPRGAHDDTCDALCFALKGLPKIYSDFKVQWL